MRLSGLQESFPSTRQGGHCKGRGKVGQLRRSRQRKFRSECSWKQVGLEVWPYVSVVRQMDH